MTTFFHGVAPIDIARHLDVNLRMISFYLLGFEFDLIYQDLK